MINISGFMLAMLPVVLSPGASFTLAMSNASVSGGRGVAKVVVGTALGIVLHGILVGLGVSRFIIENVLLLNALTLVGIGFLFYLGCRLLLLCCKPKVNRSKLMKEVTVKDAFLLNLFNVKAVLFYLTVVPIFSGADFSGYLYLSLLHIGVMALWTGGCAYLFMSAQQRLSFNKATQYVNFTGGLCLIWMSIVSAWHF